MRIPQSQNISRASSPQNKLNDTSPGLTQTAQLADLLYNTLARVAPEDIDGIQRAYVAECDGEVTISATPDDATMALYGMEPVMVAPTDMPFPIIPQYERALPPPPKKGFNREILRSVLRRIVDEA